mmetsp:Transcript_5355/g.7720  ORF Transcript_5355/g.7720 Transcript_5355/m.7720 type:complete len:963 (+) Transcript_5355:114-3002(+)
MRYIAVKVARLLIFWCSIPLSISFLLPKTSLNVNTRNNSKHQLFPDGEKCLNSESVCLSDFEKDQSRRYVLQSILLAATLFPSSASAGKPQVDDSGLLFAPKSEMSRGGSALTRGVQLERNGKRPIAIKPGEAVQSVYETRFLTYLSRFLLNVDPAARSWWFKQNTEQKVSIDVSSDNKSMPKAQASLFAEFAESVEVGLSDYFVGPYGSYGSVAAAKAGIVANKQVVSARPTQGSRKNESMAKQGVLNLYTLLKARYTSRDSKRQLALLFSMISSHDLQPTEEVRGLLGEVDNATITKIEVLKPSREKNEASSRTSPRRGGGYSIKNTPDITIDAPPALGSAYQKAKLEPIMIPSSRILKINVIDGGDGYTRIPSVKIYSETGSRCESCAILDRRGRVDSIIVLDPGFGYRLDKKGDPPEVSIDAPRNKDGFIDETSRRATAESELEYEIAGINIVSGGNGYVATEFPSISISPPVEDPDWFVQRSTYSVPGAVEDNFSLQPVIAAVKEVRMWDDTSILSPEVVSDAISAETLNQLRGDPLQLLPSTIRPNLIDEAKRSKYVISSIPIVSPKVMVPSARYRAFDPIFGPVGSVPVTKGALQLSTSEYSRLALSGAVCTVIVRTLLNPLELVKTKIQLSNDLEINEYANNMKKKSLENNSSAATGKQKTSEEVGTVEIIKSLVELRGISALFQSADITFLASLAFGSFGFGATELFRRFFTTMSFEDSGGQTGQEIILLAAAALATLVTAAVASPFEVLRVKSMGLVSARGWREVLDLFLAEKKTGSTGPFKPKDFLPLWSGFAPILSRELPFSLTKFLVFDLLAKAIVGLVNGNLDEGALPIQVGVGTTGLAISAASGAIAGVAGAIISHPADLILTLTATSKDGKQADWKEIVSELLNREGGVGNLFIGLPARSVFFFLVIGLQFFLYDYAKNVFQVGTEDLSLVLDVFYAVRQGLLDGT